MSRPLVPYARPPKLERPQAAQYSIGGVIGERLKAAETGWLIPAPDANPALTEMFRDRDRTPSRDLVPWAEEFAGKYLISAILVHRLTQNAELWNAVVHVVEDLLAAQDDEGYLGPFDRTTRLVEKWDVWGHYHVMLALLLYHEDTEDERALDASRRIADLLHRFFVVGKRRMITPDDPDGEKNYAVSHALLRLYRLTGEERYGQLVKWVEHEWDAPPAGGYLTSALAGEPVWKFRAHRWESAHDWQAITELALLTGEERYERAARHIWWSILEGDRHNTGGFTAGEACQGNPYDQGAIETCCTMAWIALSVDMLRLTGDSRVADEIELSTLNGMVGGQTPSGRWWTYDTPMDGVRKASAHHIVFQARAGSPELNCCSVNAPRGLGMIGEWAVMEAENGIALNWFGPSAITVLRKSGAEVTLRQKTEYPREGRVALTVELPRPESFALMIRIPAWSARTKAAVNGTAITDVEPGRYLVLDRTWRSGDVVRLDLDFNPHVWVGEREATGKVSLYRGPILLAYDPRYNTMDLDDVPTVALDRVSYEPASWAGRWKPWVLVRVPTTDGRELVLCDFASAGATGTYYRSWLPAEGGATHTFSRERAVWV